MTKHGSWKYAPNGYEDDASISVITGEQGVTISVRQEQAVDSYNQDFECYIVLPPDKALELLVFLQSAL